MPRSEYALPPRFESLEGLSGTGKSTVAPLLAATRGAVLVRTVPLAFQGLRRVLDRRRNVDARMALYLSALLVAAEEIQQHLDAGRPVVVESYFARCLANHRALGARLRVSLPPDLPQPVSYELTCAEPERKRRLAERRRPGSKWDLLAEDAAEGVRRAYARFPMHQVDTTGRSPNEVVQAILAIDQQKGYPRADAEPVGAHAHLLPAVHGAAPRAAAG
jgi:predicted kinase